MTAGIAGEKGNWTSETDTLMRGAENGTVNETEIALETVIVTVTETVENQEISGHAAHRSPERDHRLETFETGRGRGRGSVSVSVILHLVWIRTEPHELPEMVLETAGPRQLAPRPLILPLEPARLDAAVAMAAPGAEAAEQTGQLNGVV